MFLEQVKTIILKCLPKNVNMFLKKERKIPNYIIDNIEIFSDSHRENSDEEDSDREI